MATSYVCRNKLFLEYFERNMHNCHVLIQSNGIRIIGTGSGLHKRIVTNQEIWPQSSEWVSSVLGINERRHLDSNEDLLSLCLEAANSALSSAGISALDLDAIIIATSTPDYINPSMAAILHGKLNARESCASFDVQAVCAGFMYALGIVASLAASKSGEYFLVIGADQFSKITNFKDRNCVFFGDAAAAMIIQHDETANSKLSVELFSQGNGWDSFHTSPEEKFFIMRSTEVAAFAAKKLPESIESVCKKIGVRTDSISHFCTHQPSKPLLDKLEVALALKSGLLNRNLTKRGNTAGATVPLLFHELGLMKSIKPGELIAFAGVGAGWAWGAAIMQWPTD